MKVKLSDSHNSRNAPDLLSDCDSNRRVRNAAFFAGGALLYWALVSLVSYFAGENIVRLTPFFVGAAGYCFGVAAGSLASLSAIVIHTVVLNRAGYAGPLAAFEFNPAVHVGILLIGPLMGQLHRVTRRVWAEVQLRRSAEIELRAIDFRCRQIVDNTRAGEYDITTANRVTAAEDGIQAMGEHQTTEQESIEVVESDSTPAEAAPERSPESETVLIAVVEPTVQRQIRGALEDMGYRMLTVEDGEAALETFTGYDGRIELLITDVVLPSMNGRELAAEMRSRNPRLKVLYISGYIGSASVRVAELGPATSFLSKPFSADALERKVRLLIDAAVPEPSSHAVHPDPGVHDSAVPTLGMDDDGVHVQLGD
ncbi:MAG: response regulator [Candidatus Krumholzibacteria bacterium]|nr:response regulator [Candidatus Krumholzibacteria bacterium]